MAEQIDARASPRSGSGSSGADSREGGNDEHAGIHGQRIVGKHVANSQGLNQANELRNSVVVVLSVAGSEDVKKTSAVPKDNFNTFFGCALSDGIKTMVMTNRPSSLLRNLVYTTSFVGPERVWTHQCCLNSGPQ